MTTFPPHQCDAFCRCPVHDLPVLYRSAGGEHVCFQSECLNEWFDRAPHLARRFADLESSWEHGHPELLQGCALCQKLHEAFNRAWYGQTRSSPQPAPSEGNPHPVTEAPKLPDDVCNAIDELSLILLDHVKDPATARRCAELFEFLDQPEGPRMSVGWWRRAADMGDDDAREYLRELIDEGLADRRPCDTSD